MQIINKILAARLAPARPGKNLIVPSPGPTKAKRGFRKYGSALRSVGFSAHALCVRVFAVHFCSSVRVFFHAARVRLHIMQIPGKRVH